MKHEEIPTDPLDINYSKLILKRLTLSVLESLWSNRNSHTLLVQM